jgi:uncharacterized membrane protein
LVSGVSGDSIVTIAILIALACGAAASIAALYGHYRVLPGWLTGPEICRLEEGGCAVLFRTPRASLLGFPNAALGVLLYALLAIGVIAGWPAWWLAVMTVPAVAMSAFLGYSLISNGHQCRICWTGHVANGTLLALFIARAASA